MPEEFEESSRGKRGMEQLKEAAALKVAEAARIAQRSWVATL
jgi:hypothetical protein